jgi:hypothetical protein
VPTIRIPRRALPAGVLASLVVACLLLVAERVDAQSYPVCGGRSNGTVCQTPICGSVPAGVECLLPLCGTLPPGTPLGAPCVFGEFLPACSSVSADTSCRPDENLECGLVPDGYPCLGIANPERPSCSGNLPIDTWCETAGGEECRVVSPGQVACLVVGGAVTCTGPAQIVQECIAGTGAGSSPLLRNLTDDAIAGVLRDHQLPPSDAPLVMGYARDSVRAYLFAELLNVIVKDQHSPAEDAVVAFYTQKVQDLRVRQAQRSEAEYAKFAANPCVYAPPPGFTWPIPANCVPGSLATLFANLTHPTMKEFISYGIDGVTQEEIVGDLEALNIAARTSAAITYGTTIVIAAGLAFAAFALVAFTSIGTAVAAVITPYALVAYGLTGVAAGIGAAAASVAAVVLAVVLLIVGTVVESINYKHYDEFVADITTLAERLAVVDLRAAVETQRGMSDLFHVYVKSTQPDWPAESAPPAPSLDDPLFHVRHESGAHVAITPSIHLFTASWGQGRVLSLSTSLHGGWFRTTTLAIDDHAVPRQATSLSLGITIVDWDGKVGTAWRRGDQFVIRYVGPNNQPLDPIVTDELRFLDLGASKLSARIVHRLETRPPPPSRAGSELDRHAPRDETRGP